MLRPPPNSPPFPYPTLFRFCFGPLQPAETLRWVIPGALCLVLGCQMILTSFFLGVLRLDTRTQEETRQDHLAAQHETKRSEEHTSELQSHSDLVCRLLLEKK